MEAAIIVNSLAAAEIEATVAGTFTAGFLAEAPGDVSVMIRAEDLTRARQLLELDTSHQALRNATPIRLAPLLLIIGVPVLIAAILITYMN